MKYETIVEVIDSLIGETEPIADSAIDKERYDNLETLISVTSELLARIGEVSKSDLIAYRSAEKCIVRAQKALKGFTEDIKDELGDELPSISLSAADDTVFLSAADDIFLLSEDEWNQARKIPGVPATLPRGWWWLRSPGTSPYYASYVSDLGGIWSSGQAVQCADGGIRPAFRIASLARNDYQPGDKITVENKTVCTVIFKDVALADDIVCQHRFDPFNNNWETSKLKAFINSDEFLNML